MNCPNPTCLPLSHCFVLSHRTYRSVLNCYPTTMTLNLTGGYLTPTDRCRNPIGYCPNPIDRSPNPTNPTR